MPLDILTIGEALVEVMRTGIDQPLNQPGPFSGPYPSGAPFIFAVQAARLGLKTAAIGSVGEDAFGDCLLNQLRADGVSTEGIRQLPNQTTGVAFVAYNADGSRDFVFSLGAGGHLSADMLQPELFAGLRCFHIMGSTLSMSEDVLSVCREALRKAIDAGALISFDPNLRPELLPPEAARVAFAEFMSAADILLPTAAELLQLTAVDPIEMLLAERPEVVITRGAAGCSVYTSAGPARGRHCPDDGRHHRRRRGFGCSLLSATLSRQIRHRSRPTSQCLWRARRRGRTHAVKPAAMKCVI